jgi:hypothetical protein
MFNNNLNSDLNKKDKFTYELLGRDNDGSPGTVGQGNGGGVSYEKQPYHKNYDN